MLTLKEKISLLLPRTNYKPKSWSLTFGLPHIGIGILSRSLSENDLNIADNTGLFIALKFPPPFHYIRFNSKRYHRNLLRIFLKQNLDLTNKKLIFQESLLDIDSYVFLKKEWEAPEKSFSLTCDYEFFKKKYFLKNPCSTDSECKKIFKKCLATVELIPSQNLHVDRPISLLEFESFMSCKISKIDSGRDPLNLFHYL